MRLLSKLVDIILPHFLCEYNEIRKNAKMGCISTECE